jgi:hypothetical protein
LKRSPKETEETEETKPTEGTVKHRDTKKQRSLKDLRFSVTLCLTVSFVSSVLSLFVACGKKGPPLAPFIRIPAGVETIAAQREGNDVYVTLTIPSRNVDESTPAAVSRVEIYGYTGRTPPPRARWVEFATLVATVPVAPPPPEGEPESVSADAKAASDAPQQGTNITVRDTLTPDELVQGKVANSEPATPNMNPEPGTRNPEPVKPAPGTRNEEPAQPLRRFYTAFAFSPRGRPGPPGAVAEFAMAALPDPPPSVRVTHTERDVTLTWEPSGGLIGFLLERVLPDEPPPALELDDEAAPPSDRSTAPLFYNVYRTVASDAAAPPATPDTKPWNDGPDPPINPTPLNALSFADAVEFGREHCYTVRAVRGLGPDQVVGAASAPVCVTAADTFAPAAPSSVAAVASQGAISLIWEPNTEIDLAGYIVLRGESPGGTLRPLTPSPITDARYRDAAVTPGVRYVYAVVAVDNRFPVPNISVESDRVEETAR